jgi:hypothetical protein
MDRMLVPDGPPAFELAYARPSPRWFRGDPHGLVIDQPDLPRAATIPPGTRAAGSCADSRNGRSGWFTPFVAVIEQPTGPSVDMPGPVNCPENHYGPTRTQVRFRQDALGVQAAWPARRLDRIERKTFLRQSWEVLVASLPRDPTPPVIWLRAPREFLEANRHRYHAGNIRTVVVVGVGVGLANRQRQRFGTIH